MQLGSPTLIIPAILCHSSAKMCQSRTYYYPQCGHLDHVATRCASYPTCESIPHRIRVAEPWFEARCKYCLARFAGKALPPLKFYSTIYIRMKHISLVRAIEESQDHRRKCWNATPRDRAPSLVPQKDNTQPHGSLQITWNPQITAQLEGESAITKRCCYFRLCILRDVYHKSLLLLMIRTFGLYPDFIDRDRRKRLSHAIEMLGLTIHDGESHPVDMSKRGWVGELDPKTSEIRLDELIELALHHPLHRELEEAIPIDVLNQESKLVRFQLSSRPGAYL